MSQNSSALISRAWLLIGATYIGLLHLRAQRVNVLLLESEQIYFTRAFSRVAQSVYLDLSAEAVASADFTCTHQCATGRNDYCTSFRKKLTATIRAGCISHKWSHYWSSCQPANMIWWRCPLGDRPWSISAAGCLVSAPDVQKDLSPKWTRLGRARADRKKWSSRWIFYSFLTVKTGHFDPSRARFNHYETIFRFIYLVYFPPAVCLVLMCVAHRFATPMIFSTWGGKYKRSKNFWTSACGRLSARGPVKGLSQTRWAMPWMTPVLYAGGGCRWDVYYSQTVSR